MTANAIIHYFIYFWLTCTK